MARPFPEILARRPALMVGGRLVSIARAGLAIEAESARSKWLLLGDAWRLSEALAPVVRLPLEPLTSVRVADIGLCLWLRPNQYLLLEDAATAISLPGELVHRLAGTGAHVLDASSRFQSIAIHGKHAADLLSVGCSLDFRQHNFHAACCVQTRIEQVPVVIQRDSPERFCLLVERPLAAHLWLWLHEAAREFTTERS